MQIGRLHIPWYSEGCNYSPMRLLAALAYRSSHGMNERFLDRSLSLHTRVWEFKLGDKLVHAVFDHEIFCLSMCARTKPIHPIPWVPLFCQNHRNTIYLLDAIFIVNRCHHSLLPRHRSVMHYSDVIMGALASEITSLTIVYSTVYWGADQRKHQSSASLAFVREFTGHRWIPRTKAQ